jgi:hypothetical protein
VPPRRLRDPQRPSAFHPPLRAVLGSDPTYCPADRRARQIYSPTRSQAAGDTSKLHVYVWIHTFTCDAARNASRNGGERLVRSLPRRRHMSQRGVERTSGRLRQTPASGDTSLRNPARGCLKPGLQWTAHEAESADVASWPGGSGERCT